MKTATNKQKLVTKKDLVKAYLNRYGSITPMQAIEKFSCLRLADVVFRLKKEGMQITTDISKGYAIYRVA